MLESELKKNRSIEILQQKNIPFIKHLPEIEDERTSTRRSG